MSINLETLLIIGLTTYRLTLLISKESGPFDMMGKFRTWTGVKFDQYSTPYATNQLSAMVICPYCLSVWVAICVTLFLVAGHLLKFDELFLTFLLPFALSGLAVFLFKWAGV